MAELAAALAALSGGKSSSSASPVPSPTPISPSNLAQPGWFVPPHLLRLPHCRATALTAHECSREAAAHPTDFERVYRYGLSLQELASKVAQQPEDQLALLHQAAEVYYTATTLLETPRLHVQGGRHAAALYNWAVALTDIARLVRAQQPEEAYECLTAAASKYAQSLAVQPDNPQANNNWGLVLQDLSSLRPAAERRSYLHHSLHKFRRAIRLRPDFDRACYNLGTVLYSHACSLQEALLASQEQQEAEALASSSSSSDTLSRQRSSSIGVGVGSPVMAAAAAAAVMAGSSGRAGAERAVQATFAHAAQYIALAYAMQPGKQVYADSLAAVQRLLPLPYLRAGPLLAVHPDTADSPGEQWLACWFGLGREGLAAMRPPAAYAGQGLPAAPPHIAYDLADVANARLVADPSLPAGGAIWLSLHSKPRGVYLVAPDKDDAEGWCDALLLLSHLLRAGRMASVQAALSVRR